MRRFFCIRLPIRILYLVDFHLLRRIVFSFCVPVPVVPVRFQRYLLFLILYITIYILISYIYIIENGICIFLIGTTGTTGTFLASSMMHFVDFQPFRKNNSFANLTVFTNSSQPPLHRGFLKLILYLQIKIGFARAVYFGIRRGDFGAVEIIGGGDMSHKEKRLSQLHSCLSSITNALA